MVLEKYASDEDCPGVDEESPCASVKDGPGVDEEGNDVDHLCFFCGISHSIVGGSGRWCLNSSVHSVGNGIGVHCSFCDLILWRRQSVIFLALACSMLAQPVLGLTVVLCQRGFFFQSKVFRRATKQFYLSG